jgi:hypothetical protein
LSTAITASPGSPRFRDWFREWLNTPEVVGQAENIRYASVDISPTMVAEAVRCNAELVAAGSRDLGLAEHMPLPHSSCDCVFSIGAAHFSSSQPGAI